MRKVGLCATIGISLLWPAAAQAPSGSRLVAVPAAEIKAIRSRLDPALLPTGSSHLEITRGQTFALTDGTATVLTLVPVEFFLSRPNQLLSVCGLYMLPAQGPARFAVTYGMTPEDDNDDVEDSWQCARTTAMGVMPAEGSHPRLLLTMAGFSPPRFETVMPIVMVWDAAKASYVAKDKVFRDNSFPGEATIAKMRRGLLAKPR